MAQPNQARRRPPELIRPMLATPGGVPAGPQWSYEFKWDGVRAVAYCTPPGQIQLLSRNDNDVTTSYPELHAMATLLDTHHAVLDGEIVALDRGRPSFGQLQHRMHARSPSAELQRRVPVTYYVFDLLVLDHTPLLNQPFSRRRALLDQLELDDHTGPVRVPPTYRDIGGQRLLDVARSHGLEGIVAKHLDSRYEPGRRSRAWIKTALLHTQEVVICGWKPGQGRRAGTIGSILLGAYDTTGELRFIGHVGTGFTERALGELSARLDPLACNHSPFNTPVPREHARDAKWVQPVLVGEVEYRTMTSDNQLRHASWRGLRTDKPATEAKLPAQP